VGIHLSHQQLWDKTLGALRNRAFPRRLRGQDMTRRAASHDTLLAESGWQALVLHDVRAPLAIVSGQAQLLRRRDMHADTAPAAESRELAVRLDRILRAVSLNGRHAGRAAGPKPG
jgi:signal transduction histidine kinase